MSEVTDQLVWDEAISNDINAKIFSDRDTAWVQDNNAGSYSGGQIVIDASTLSNQDRMQSWREAYLEIPIVLSLSSPGAAATGFGNAALPCAMAMKSGFWQLIHSIDVQVNGQSTVQLTPYTNAWVGFRMASTLSDNDALKLGPSLGFAKDSPLSFRWSPFATPSVDGVGVCNNRGFANVAPLNVATAVQEISNTGLLARQRDTAFDPSQAPFNVFTNATNAGTVGKSYYLSQGGDAGFKAIFVVATIRLKDMCPFFDAMPLVKGANVRLTINTNVGTVPIITSAGPLLTSAVSGINVQGGTFPAMLSSAFTSNGSAALPSVAATYQYNVSIARVQNSQLASNGLTHPSLQAARLYIPMYQLNPEFLSQYLTLGTKRTVKYTDVMQFSVNNIAPGGQINALISNGVVNPRRLIVLPYLAAATASSIPPPLSPFDSAPATTTPCVALTNTNVQIGGLNIYNQNQSYDFETFMNELSTQGLNGQMTTGLTSGLINEVDFSSSYRFYVYNISRRMNSEDGLPKSVQFLGTNASQVALDLFCFVEYERSITIDTITGQISQ